MIELLVFIIVLIILTPALLVASILFNIDRRIKGQKPLTTEEAVKELTRNMFKKISNFINQTTNLFNAQDAKLTKKNTKVKQNIDDAEYREVK